MMIQQQESDTWSWEEAGEAWDLAAGDYEQASWAPEIFWPSSKPGMWGVGVVSRKEPSVA